MLVTLAVAARLIVSGSRPLTDVVVTNDDAIPAVVQMPGSRELVEAARAPQRARAGHHSATPLVSLQLVVRLEVPSVVDAITWLPAAPGERRDGNTHDATGPPAPLLT